MTKSSLPLSCLPLSSSDFCFEGLVLDLSDEDACFLEGDIDGEEGKGDDREDAASGGVEEEDEEDEEDEETTSSKLFARDDELSGWI